MFSLHLIAALCVVGKFNNTLLNTGEVCVISLSHRHHHHDEDYDEWKECKVSRRSKENEKNPEVWMLAPSMKINKISRENKLKVLKIVWAHMKMLFGTTEVQRVCNWNVFFGFSCNFLEPKEWIESEINNPSLRRSCNIMTYYVSSKRDPIFEILVLLPSY